MYTGHSFKNKVAIHKRYCDGAIEGYKSAKESKDLALVAAAILDEREAKKQADYLLSKIRNGNVQGVITQMERLKLVQKYERLFLLRHQKIEAAKPVSNGVLLK